MGLSGLLVRFSDRLEPEANTAAIAFRADLESDSPEGMTETAVSLASVFVGIDALRRTPADLRAELKARLAARDWRLVPLPAGRRRWTIPAIMGGPDLPQFEAVAGEAGLSPDSAREAIAGQTLRVLAIGFAPGQPYLGPLPPAFGVPRRKDLNRAVPAGALVCALRQLTLFSAPGPTGWHHIGQTAFAAFRPEADRPAALVPGDEVRFAPVPPDRLPPWPEGGARSEPLP